MAYRGSSGRSRLWGDRTRPTGRLARRPYSDVRKRPPIGLPAPPGGLRALPGLLLTLGLGAAEGLMLGVAEGLALGLGLLLGVALRLLGAGLGLNEVGGGGIGMGTSAARSGW
jgi:hypothetical protein